MLFRSAKAGSVNVLGGAPFGYRYVRKSPRAGAVYEIIEHEAALVSELLRRYADDGASIAELARWLTQSDVPSRTGKQRWGRSVIWGMLRNPAIPGARCSARPWSCTNRRDQPGRPAARPVHPTCD